MNNNWWCENIRATNPCGEQPLPPYGACLLGSVNLTSSCAIRSRPRRRVRLGRIPRFVRVFTRMLDNVVEINGLPLEQQRDEILRKRRHGMGFLGLGSTITMLAGSTAARSRRVHRGIVREMAMAGWEAAPSWPKEKAPAPIMNEEFEVTAEMLRKRPRWSATASQGGQDSRAKCCTPATAATCAGRRWRRSWSTELAGSAPVHHHSSIAPTGTISLSLANNASNGIEPSFAHHYFRNVIREVARPRKASTFSFELLAYRELVNANAMPAPTTPPTKLPTTSSPPTTSREGARRHPGRGAEVGRFLDLEDRQRPHRLPVRGLQGHLPVRPRAGPEGLHHLPLQPGPSRACWSGRGPREHDLPLRRWTTAAMIEVKGDEEIEYDGAEME